MPKEKNELEFPIGFLWGASTASYQVEGGIENDWTAWEEKNKFRLAAEANERWDAEQKKKFPEMLNHDNYICGKACDSYNRFDEDLECIKELNLTAYRFSIEWARIEPEKGVYNKEAISYYKEVISKLKKNNVKIVLTIWHWTLPVWVAEQGGWASKKTIGDFLKYVDLVVDEFGDDVSYWVVLNEPTIHVFNGYMTDKFPPLGKSSVLRGIIAYNNLIKAYKQSYTAIHSKYPRAKVSNSQIMNYFEAKDKHSKFNKFIAKSARFLWDELFMYRTKGYFDYVGMSYYFHDRVSLHKPFIDNENKIKNDMGWEIYPEGIYHVLKNMSKYKKPIIILENGLADKYDKHRAKFIKEHLFYVHKAIQEGVDVKGYLHWSLLDNFEWAAGFWPYFGLYKVNRKTYKRTARSSAKLYSKICKSNKLKI